MKAKILRPLVTLCIAAFLMSGIANAKIVEQKFYIEIESIDVYSQYDSNYDQESRKWFQSLTPGLTVGAKYYGKVTYDDQKANS